MIPLQPDTSYHIYNHANGFENIFSHEANYWYFLEKYKLYIEPIAETYACCLMPNHFHLVIRIRKKEVIEEAICKARNIKTGFLNLSQSSIQQQANSNLSQSSIAQQGENFGRGLVISDKENFEKGFNDKEIEKYLSKQFANLFSCYTQSFNKVYNRMGSLFIKNFKRELITDKTHFLNTVVYVHRNPVHHGFCKDFDEWPFSSYRHITANEPFEIKIETAKLIKMATNREALIQLHQKSLTSFTNSNKYFDLPVI
jgi:putative transposase